MPYRGWGLLRRLFGRRGLSDEVVRLFIRGFGTDGLRRLNDGTSKLIEG